MTDFRCKKCGSTFANNYTLKRHQENSLSCKNSGSKTNKIEYYSCNKCSKKFTRKDSLKKHKDLGRCQETNKVEVKSKVNGNNNVVSNTAINGNKNKTTTNNIIDSPVMINLVFFGEDGIKSLGYDEINEMFKSRSNLVEYLIKTVNLNPKKPQHHNILYTNLRSAYGKAFKNDKWVDKKIDELIDMLIEAKLEDLNDILNDMVFLNEETKEKIRKTITNLDYKKRDERKKLGAYIKPILYNHRDMIIKTMKMVEKQRESDESDDEEVVVRKKSVKRKKE